jgi:hypothetical protein
MKSAVSHSWSIICGLLLVAATVSGQQTKVGPPELALQTGHFGSVLAAAFPRTPLMDPDRNNITAIAFSLNGKLLARAVGIGRSFPAKIRIWDIAKNLWLTIGENSEGITQISFLAGFAFHSQWR